MRQEIIDLYDDFTHRSLDRRAFMEKLTAMVGSAAAAAMVVRALEANPAAAAMVAEDDPRITAERVDMGGGLMGYFARPAEAAGPLPGIVVVHENRGLNPHLEDVARRAATAGFMAVAVDFLSGKGGTPADADQAREMIGELDADAVVADARKAIAWLAGQEGANGNVGIVGFCWGGGVVGRVAVAEPELDAGVVFYGAPPDAAGVPAIQAPLLLNYAGLDERINAMVPDFTGALDAAGKTYQVYVYDGANHAFHNDTSAERYNEEAATLAWERTMAFFHETLG
jgi:carboxymethylenebutenolidase